MKMEYELSQLPLLPDLEEVIFYLFFEKVEDEAEREAWRLKRLLACLEAGKVW